MGIYSGVSAHLYDLWFGQEQSEDQAFYQYYIEQKKGPALEIGSGTGRLLLPYLRDGLNVEGVEPSQDMIALCKEKAHLFDVTPVIYKQTMEELALSKKYATIFIPLCTFQMIVDRSKAQEALQRLYSHLQDGGQLLISLFIPWIDSSGANQNVWRVRQSSAVPKHVQKVILPNENIGIGSYADVEVILSEALRNDTFDQIHVQRLKYEFYSTQFGHDIQKKLSEISFFKMMQFRWYYRFEFQMMLHQAGFKKNQLLGDYTFYDASEGTETFIWRAIK